MRLRTTPIRSCLCRAGVFGAAATDNAVWCADLEANVNSCQQRALSAPKSHIAICTATRHLQGQQHVAAVRAD